MSEIDDESLMRELAEDFGVEEKQAGRSALEQRVLAGFEEIERFVEQQGREPQNGEGHDIFERLYAVRLDRLRQSLECRAVLKDLDKRGLLGPGRQCPPGRRTEADDAFKRRKRRYDANDVSSESWPQKLPRRPRA